MHAGLYSYFDEAYFEDGEKRGTAYVKYKEGARKSPTFREIAQAVRDVFQPRRVLEIGCATGIMVRHLNESGCEAHGVDVSEWAVRNAEHRNVRLASADDLPYADGHFDLVVSCHSLEHLPDAILDRALAELTRVSSGFQFHMLPILGRPPYDGDRASVLQGLRKDPTHQQLQEFDWWIEQFRRNGQTAIEGCILFKNDNQTGELSTCQFMTQKHSGCDSSGVLRRATARNQRIFREIQIAGVSRGWTQGSRGVLRYENRVWKDIEARLGGSDTVNLTGKTLELVIVVDGGACTLRFAAGQDTPGQAYAHVGEFYVHSKPGCNVFRFTTDQLKTLRGHPDYSKINHLALGGENENVEVVFYFADQNGLPVLT